jgi:biotin synthase
VESGNFDEEIILTLFKESKNPKNAQALFSHAIKLRDEYLGRYLTLTAHVHMTTPCSVYPRCLYCALSSSDPYVRSERDTLSSQELIDAIKYVTSYPEISSVILVGGTNLKGFDKLIHRIIKKIREITNIDLAIDVGPSFSSENTFDYLKSNGVTTIYSSIETINPKVFKEAKPGDSLHARISLMELAEKNGFNIGTIIMNGLGNDLDLIKSLLYLKRFKNLKYLYIYQHFILF